MIKVRYPRTAGVLVAMLIGLLLERYLSNESWWRALRFALILGAIFAITSFIQWWRDDRRR